MPKVDLMEHITRPGKFQGEPRIVEELYGMDADEEFGDVEYGGFYRLFVRLSPLDFSDIKGEVTIGRTRAVILREDSDGFIAARFFESDDAARRKWEALEKAHLDEYNDEEDEEDE